MNLKSSKFHDPPKYNEVASKVKLREELAGIVQRLSALLLRAQETYDHIDKDINQFQMVTIKDISSEILSNILLIASEEGRDKRCLASLSLVCQNWNDTIKGTAKLWSRIDIDVNSDVLFVHKPVHSSECCSFNTRFKRAL
ncbi:hypothetical protein CPB86DRAFT_600840 [Serendipita vermifera]|nr:hypothetical protein CPB86DRAFT_600840 [Serendipita vermifera]